MNSLISSQIRKIIHPRRLINVLSSCVCILAVLVINPTFASGIPIDAGDIFIDVAIGYGYTRDNQIWQFSPNGELLDTFDFGISYDMYWDMGFDKSSTLYAVFQNTASKTGGVIRIGKDGNELGSFGSGGYAYPVSIAFDKAGNVYIGQDSPDRGTHPSILKFDKNGNLLATYPVSDDPSSGFGVLYAAMSADQCTLRYTSDGDSILQFNVCTGMQLPNLVASIPEPSDAGSGTEVLSGLQELPDGDLLVGTWDTVFLLNSSGGVIKNYKDVGANPYGWYPANIALDPDGKSFWILDDFSGKIYHINIQTGGIISEFNSFNANFYGYGEGISVAPQTNTCQAVLNNSVPKPDGGGTQMRAAFTPNFGYTLAQAAQLCGFSEFDWQSTVTSLPLPSAVYAVGSNVPLHAPPPFNDPPPNGYAYQNPPNAVKLPVYWNLFTPTSDKWSLAAHETTTTLSFLDVPTDDCLYGGSGNYCGGMTAPKGAVLGFRTHVVGIKGTYPDAKVVDTGIGFTWTDSFNGTSGGISVMNSTRPVDPGSGTGGITITGVSEVSTLSGGSGPPVPNPQPLPAGNECNGVFGGTFNGNVTVSMGQSCTVVNGSINGSIFVDGGSLTLSGTWVNGDLVAQGAAALSVNSFSAIYGNLTINRLPSSNTVGQVCSSTIYGNLLVHNNAASIDIGSLSPSPSATACPGNVIGSNMEVKNNAGVVLIYGNVVTNTLTCINNSSIAGAGNSAIRKHGQCSAL